MRSKIKTKNSLSAFTIIELVVVISVISILATLAIITYGSIRKDSRDATRNGNATIISEALEKYYDRNGEYPSVASLDNTNPSNTGTAIASKLSISIDSLRMPQMPSSATNSITADPTPSNDYIAYIGKSDVNNTDCQQDVNGGCDQFTLRYIEESGATKVIESRHKGRSGDTPSTSDDPAPTLALSVTAPNVVASVTAFTPCDPTTLTPKFAFRYRTKGGNDTNWTNWSDPSSTWTTSQTFNLSGTQGTTYEFEAYSRCDNGATPGASTIASSRRSIVYPITPPTGPTVSTTTYPTTVTIVISLASCPSDTSPQYSYRQQTNGAAYTAWSGWSTTRAYSRAASQGYQYTFQAKARCIMDNINSAEAIGPEEVYVHPISATSAPTVTASPWTGTSVSYDWNDIVCPTGTSTQYQREWSREGYASGFMGPATTTNYTVNTTLQGYQYSLAVQARCVSAYATGPWSATGSAGTITPIASPGIPTGFNAVMAADRSRVTWTWTAPTCGAGTRAEHEGQLFGWWGSPRNEWGWPPDNDWNQPAQGFWSASYAINSSNLGSGYRLAVRKRYICVNTTSGRTSTMGAIGTSPEFVMP